MSTEQSEIPQDIPLDDAKFSLPFGDDCPVYHFQNEQRLIQSGILKYQGEHHVIERHDDRITRWTYLYVLLEEKIAVVV